MSDEFLHVNDEMTPDFEENQQQILSSIREKQQILSSIREISQFCVTQRGNLSSHKNASENEHPEVFKDRANQMHVNFEN